MISPVLAFFLLGLFFLILELTSFTYFLLFFGIGSFLTSLIGFFTSNLYILFSSFSFFVLIGSLLARYLLKKRKQKEDPFARNPLHEEILLQEDFSGSGFLSCMGTIWQAQGTPAKKGEILIVESFKDNQILVRKK